MAEFRSATLAWTAGRCLELETAADSPCFRELVFNQEKERLLQPFSVW